MNYLQLNETKGEREGVDVGGSEGFVALLMKQTKEAWL